MFARIVFTALIASLGFTAFAQIPKLTPKEQAEARKMSARFMAIQTLLRDPVAAKEFGLDSSKRQKIQIAIQKYMDEMQRTGQQGGRKFDMEAYRKKYKELMTQVDGELTAEQRSQLTKRGEDQMKRIPSLSAQSQDQMKEMQRLQSMMSELQKLSYDPALAEEIELTIEQRVQIREASQKFAVAMRNIQKPGEAFDMNQYNQLVGDLVLDAQGILTVEQAEKMALSAKISQLKAMHGDVFGVVNGLAAEFELSANESQKLRESILEARQDYYEKLQMLREDTLEKILSELPVKRREEVRQALSGQLKPNRNEMRGLPKPEKKKD